MRKLSLSIVAATGWFAAGAVQGPTGGEWQDNQNLSFGKEKARAAFSSFDSVKESLNILPEYSPRAISLDSDDEWKFKWVKDPTLRPKGFQYEDYDVSGWETIKVPCSWQAYGANGKGGWGTPIYTNIKYPFATDTPGGSKVVLAPPKEYTAYLDRNPVGSYRREFKVPGGWLDGESDVFLKFDGVDSFFYLWVNGEYVGFSKDSRSPAEFDVTRFLRKGRNTVALEVYRYSDGSYLEDQDMFRLSGIFRGTWLLKRPKDRIRDFFATARPCVRNQYRGSWEVTVEADGEVGNIYLYDMDDKLVAGPFAAKTFTVNDVKPWSAEEPNCYKLVLEGRKEVVSAIFGFRVSEIKNGRYYLNGQKIKLKGANRHETDPMYGHYVPKSRHEQDIRMMKEANCNTVRNSHYPQDDYWYYLCNVEGLYVVDEANVESHGYGYGENSLSHRPEWTKATVDRNMAMVERNKNHPCVVIWSYGNEAGPGENFAAARDVIKARDTTRPTHYERDWSVADMDGCQYPAVAWTWQKAREKNSAKPFYISEYAHNMANAMGNLKDYQDAIESSDVILGATIWDWVDQGLYKVDDEGRRILAYGGDFGDKPNDGLFVMNGCVLSDRTPEPGYNEIRHVYQNWSVKATNFYQRVVIRNKNYFTSSKGVELKWTLLADGKATAKGEIPVVGLGPQQEIVVDMPPEAYRTHISGKTVSVRFSFTKDGREVASDQIDLMSSRNPDSLAGGLPWYTYVLPDFASNWLRDRVDFEEDAEKMVFRTDDMEISFSKADGMPVSIKEKGLVFWSERLKSPMRLDLFRAPSSNENGLGTWWRSKGFVRPEVKSVEIGPVTESDRVRTFTALTEWSGGFVVAARWSIYPNGTVACVTKTRPVCEEATELARIGFSFELDLENPKVEWFGLGPWENYPDRKSGAFLGLWKADANDFFFPYARNEDSGNREETRGFKVGNLAIRTLGAPFAFEVNPYTPEELVAKAHPPELAKSEKTYVGVFAATRGLGGASCGPAPMDRDVLKCDRDYDLSFTLSFGDDVLTARAAGSGSLPALPEKKVEAKARIFSCSSREPGEGDPEHLIDGNLDTIWHSQYGTTMGNFPHVVAVELPEETTLKGLTVYGRRNGVNGRVRHCAVETSLDGATWEKQVEDELANTAEEQDILFFKPVKAKFYRFTALDNHYGNDFASMAEIKTIE